MGRQPCDAYYATSPRPVGKLSEAPFHSIEFKRQVAQEFIAGETLHALARRHDVSRNLIRVWTSVITGPTASPSPKDAV
jgi:transposase-like protein